MLKKLTSAAMSSRFMQHCSTNELYKREKFSWMSLNVTQKLCSRIFTRSPHRQKAQALPLFISPRASAKPTNVKYDYWIYGEHFTYKHCADESISLLHHSLEEKSFEFHVVRSKSFIWTTKAPGVSWFSQLFSVVKFITFDIDIK